jgi:hypothetical protein
MDRMSIKPSSSSSSFVETLPGDIPLEECPICMERFALSTANTRSAIIPCCDGGESDEEEGEEEKQKENEVAEIRNQKTNDDDGTRSTHYRLAKERLFIPICRHQFCRECLIRHCEHAISIKAIPIVCPKASATYHCAAVLPDDLVKDLFLRRWTTPSKKKTTASSKRSGSSSCCSSSNRPKMDLGQFDEDETSLGPPSFDAAAFPKHPHEECGKSRKQKKQQQQQQQQNSIRSEEENATPIAAVPFAVPTIAFTTDAVVVAMGEEGGDGVFWLEPSSSPDWLKYQRFQRMLQDPSLIPCTKCQELLSPPPPPTPSLPALQETETNTKMSSPPNESLTTLQEGHHHHHHHNHHLQPQQQPEKMNQLTCHSCGHVFCRIHGDSHPPHISCEEYSQSTDAEQVQESEEAIRSFTKPCSHCGARIERESGCDFMTCGFCYKEMCFKCGTHVHLSGSSGNMLRFCTQCRQLHLDVDDDFPGTGWIMCFWCSCFSCIFALNLLVVLILCIRCVLIMICLPFRFCGLDCPMMPATVTFNGFRHDDNDDGDDDNHAEENGDSVHRDIETGLAAVVTL